MKLLAACACMALLPGVSMAADLVRVIDGDTIVVRDNGRNVHLRVAGVDAPEMSQRAGPAAKAFTEQLCVRQPVSYRRTAIDRYHRTVAHVQCGAADLANSLRQAGHLKHKVSRGR